MYKNKQGYRSRRSVYRSDPDILFPVEPYSNFIGERGLTSRNGLLPVLQLDYRGFGDQLDQHGIIYSTYLTYKNKINRVKINALFCNI